MNTKRKFTKILSYQGVKAVVRRCSAKKVFLEIWQNSQENTCIRISFLIKLQAKACNFIKKETLTQVFPCEFCEISTNTVSYKTTRLAASVHGLKSNTEPLYFKKKMFQMSFQLLWPFLYIC